MATADATADDTTTQTPPPASPPAGSYDPAMLNRLLQQLMQPQQPPQPVAQPSSTEGRGALSLLGEAIGGGEQYGTTQQREAAGLRALQSMGMNMMANSGYAPVRTPFGQILASGMQGAQQSLGESQSVEAAQMGAQQQYAEKQQEMNLQRIKVALPLLTLQTQMQQAAAARNLASPSTSVATGGSIAGNTYEGAIAGHEGLTADKNLPTTVGGFIPSTWQAFATANPDLFKGMSPDQVAAARSDPKLNAAGITWLAQNNAPVLTKYGAPVTGQSLGIAHYLGAEPTAGVMAASDNTPVRNFVSDAAVKANPELATLTVGQLKQRYASVPDPSFVAAAKGQPGAPPVVGGPAAVTAATKPPAPTVAAPGSGFGTSAFNAPTRTIMPAPSSQADAPNTTATLPPVPTPQMVAARSLAVKAGRPMPIAGTDGLFANPDGSVGPGPGGGGLGRRADINAIVGGTQQAQTTMPPSSVVGAGPAAGGGTALTVSPPAPAGAFGGGAFTTAPAQTVGTPAAPAPPQVTAPATPPPAPTSTAPTPTPPQLNPDIKAGDLTIRHPGSFADYRASQYVPPTGEDFNPNLTPPQLAAFAARRQQVDFDRQNIANLPFAQQPEAVAKWKAEDAALTADQQNAAQAKAQAAAAAKTKYDETQQKDIQQRYTDQATAYTTAAQAQLAAKNKMQENEQTSNLASKQKVLEGLDTEATSAHENLTQLQMVKELSDAAGQPGVLASYPELRSWLVKTGVATDAQAQQWSAQQALDAAANRLTLAMRSGSGMSRLTNMDLQFLQHASPQSFNPQDWRDAQIAYLMNTYQRQQQFTGLVHRGVADGMSLADAQAAADKELGPTIKQTPTTDANGAPLMPVDRDRWNWDNLMPGSFYKNPSGNLKIFKPKPDAMRP